MSREDFWNDREAAQKLMDEGSGIRRKLDPIRSGDRKLEDIAVMMELGLEEPEDIQATMETELAGDLASLRQQLEELEHLFKLQLQNQRRLFFIISARIIHTWVMLPRQMEAL